MERAPIDVTILGASNVTLQLKPPVQPMEAETVEEVPTGGGWQYEPKWDGFRCLAFRDGKDVYLQSKSGQPLARYFPEVVELMQALPVKRFVLDSELVIPEDGSLSFDKLLLRLHPAESRVRKLAAETPASVIVFDLLADEKGKSLLGKKMSERRPMLQAFAQHFKETNNNVLLSPATQDIKIARKWLSGAGTSLDGIIAKLLDAPYTADERTAMVKIKPQRTVDCVIGGFRYATGKPVVGSLLLGLYDEKGLLHHVGFCSGIKSSEKPELTKKLKALVQAPGFTGNAPGGPSRWATERSTQWEPLKPELVVEVSFDHMTGGRFRHGTRLLRWRPDKKPRQCTFDQVRTSDSEALKLLLKSNAA